MPLPPVVDQRIRARFETLLEEAEQVIRQMEGENTQRRQRDRQRGWVFLGSYDLALDAFASLQTKNISLLQLLATNAPHITNMIEEVRSLDSEIAQAQRLLGIIRGLKDDYEFGMLENLSSLIEANIASDYMGQVEQLLGEGVPGQYDYVPAAVLTGAILEDALRRLCSRQTPPIDTQKPSGGPKTLDPLITDLQKANVFNKAKADQLKSWAKVRNYAAHGEFAEFNRADVEAMIAGVKTFLGDYL